MLTASPENILTDRTIWDVCSFTMLAKSIGTHDKSQFVNAAMTLREQYDVVFYIEPVGVEMEDNGVRETNLEYRADINQEILRLLSLFPPKKLVILHGSTKDRVKTVLDALK